MGAIVKPKYYREFESFCEKLKGNDLGDMAAEIVMELLDENCKLRGDISRLKKDVVTMGPDGYMDFGCANSLCKNPARSRIL